MAIDNVKFSFIRDDVKKMSNFTIDSGIKRAFKLEVIKNGDVMSSVIETLMESYITKSRELHAKAAEQGSNT